MKQRIGRSAAEAGTATQGELRQEGRACRLQVGMGGREIRLRLGHIGPAQKELLRQAWRHLRQQDRTRALRLYGEA